VGTRARAIVRPRRPAAKSSDASEAVTKQFDVVVVHPYPAETLAVQQAAAQLFPLGRALVESD